MKKAIIIVGLFFCMVGALSWADEPLTLRVKTEVANVRAEPDINGEVVARVNSGTVLDSLGKNGNWYKVELIKNGKAITGYIHSSVVDIVRESAAEVQEEEEERPVRQATAKKAPRPSERSASVETSYSNGVMVHGGLSLASMTYPDNVDDGGYNIDEYLKRKTGFMGGISFDMGKQLGLEIGFFYIQKGVAYAMEMEQEGLAFKVDGKLFLDEISAPILLKIRFSPGSTPFIVAGGEIAYVLSSKFDWSVEADNGERESGSEDLIEQVNRIDYGLVFGAGYEMKMGGSSLVIQGRYHLGLADLAKKELEEGGGLAPVNEGEWTKSNAIVLMLGIKF